MKTRILLAHFAVVILLSGQHVFSMNSSTNSYSKRSSEVLQNIEKSSRLADDYFLNDDNINFVLSDLNRSNNKLYKFKNIEIFGNIDVLQSKTLKIYTNGTVSNYWNANIIGNNNRGVFLKGRPDNATFGALSLLGSINALRLIPELGQEILVFTNQNYVYNGITEWIYKWKNNNWRTKGNSSVKHQMLWKELDRQTARHLVQWNKFRNTNRKLLSFPTESLSNIEEKILTYADRVINWLNTQTATFSHADIEKVVRFYVANRDVATKIIEKIKEQALLVGIDGRGIQLYTGKKYKESEDYVMVNFRDFSNTLAHVQCTEESLNNILNKDEYSFLSDEQISAIKNLIHGSNFGVLIGKAGTGKTTAMKAMSEVLKANGSRVIGMCLSAIASENLKKEANIESQSIAGWCYRWESYDDSVNAYNALTSAEEKNNFKTTLMWRNMKEYSKFLLKKGDVIVVDEASMVSTNDWVSILKFAKRFGAKVIAVGDNHQFTPISAGNMFEQFVQKSVQVNELKEIRRQRQAWQREASIEFSKLNTRAALEIYKDHGKIHEVDDNLENIVVDKYFEHFEKEKSVVVLCSTKRECSKINNQIRELLIKKNKLGKNLVKVNGKSFAENEKVMFLENSNRFNVKNGQQGTVKSFENGFLKIETEDGAIKLIDLKSYEEITYAYAIVLHKAQGKTYDNTIVIAHKNMINSRAVYVGMTRHRDDVDFYYRRSIFESFEKLVEIASRYEYHSSLVDYQDIDNSNRNRVAEFIKLYEQIDNKIDENKVNQNEYQSKKNRVVCLGEEILGDYDAHKLYLKQMGLTRETVEAIHAELKNASNVINRNIIDQISTKRKMVIDQSDEISRKRQKIILPTQEQGESSLLLENKNLSRTKAIPLNQQIKSTQEWTNWAKEILMSLCTKY